jgi:integrase
MPRRLSKSGKTGPAAVLDGAHRTTKATASAYYIRITAWRGAGAPAIGAYSAPTKAEAEALEAADGPGLAKRYTDEREGTDADVSTIGALLAAFEGSLEFRKCSKTTKVERSRLIKAMATESIPLKTKLGGTRLLPLATFPTKALKPHRAIVHFEHYRDAAGEAHGARSADARIQLLKLAINWGMKRGYAPANPCAGIGELWATDRSEMIWEPQHVEIYLGAIRKGIREAEAMGMDSARGRELITILAARRDALLLALGLGMRREDLSVLAYRNRQGPAYVYTARKGDRRARTAGKSRGVTIVPVSDLVLRIFTRRQEATGADSPWVITSTRGAPYTPAAFGKLVNEYAASLQIDRHLHDAKGTFVTEMVGLGVFTYDEIGRMVDWAVDDVERIARRYVSASKVASAMIERMKRRKPA